MKKDAFYFPHDSNASKDPKITSLRVKTGLAGYGFFWLMIELLRESKDYQYPNDQAMLEVALSLPQATLKPLLETCLEVGLFVLDGAFITSKSLSARMKLIDRRREILRQAGRRGYEVKAGLSHPQATLKPPLSSKVKESKGKESKEKESKGLKTKEGLLLEIPTDLLLNEPEIKDWLEYKAQKGQSYKPKGLEAFWRSLKAIPAENRRASIDQSMANNWAGLFPLRSDNGQQRNSAGRNSGIGDVERPDSKYADIVKTVRND